MRFLVLIVALISISTIKASWRIECFENVAEPDKLALLESFVKTLQEDCKVAPTPFVDPDDITLGAPWLNPKGPTYIVFSEDNKVAGFLAVGWRLSKDLTEEDGAVPTLVSDFKALEPFSCIKMIAKQDMRTAFRQSDNIFMYVHSEYRRSGAATFLLTQALPDILNSRFQENIAVRYSALLGNRPSINLFLKVALALGLYPECYAFIDNDVEGGKVIGFVLRKGIALLPHSDLELLCTQVDQLLLQNNA